MIYFFYVPCIAVYKIPRQKSLLVKYVPWSPVHFLQNRRARLQKTSSILATDEKLETALLKQVFCVYYKKMNLLFRNWRQSNLCLYSIG